MPAELLPEVATLAAYTLAVVGLVLSPGPDTAFVLAQSLGGGREAGARAAAGVATGVLVHTVAAVAGLSVLFEVSAVAYDLVRLAGAAYLVYLGVATLRGGDGGLDVAAGGGAVDSAGSGAVDSAGGGAVDSAGGGAVDSAGGGVAASRSFRQGLVTNVLNPKVALFFLAFLPQFGAGVELLPLGALYAAITAGYLGALAVASGTARALVDRPGVRTWLRRTAGGTMLVLGGAVALGDARP